MISKAGIANKCANMCAVQDSRQAHSGVLLEVEDTQVGKLSKTEFSSAWSTRHDFYNNSTSKHKFWGQTWTPILIWAETVNGNRNCYRPEAVDSKQQNMITYLKAGDSKQQNVGMISKAGIAHKCAYWCAVQGSRHAHSSMLFEVDKLSCTLSKTKYVSSQIL